MDCAEGMLPSVAESSDCLRRRGLLTLLSASKSEVTLDNVISEAIDALPLSREGDSKSDMPICESISA
jgi:hypothetical protein